jgi:TPR repeat protein
MLLLSTPALADAFGKAMDAYQAGEYRQAFVLLKPLASQGDASAQYHIGTMYTLGQGVDLNYKEGVEWLRQAAEQGHREAAITLGKMYLSGHGVEQDEAEGKKWMDLAAKLAQPASNEDDCD